MLNITDIDIPQEKIIEIGAKFVAPFMITLFILIFLTFLIIGLINVRESKGKFMAIWAMTLVISIMFLTAFILLPTTMYEFTQFFVKLFN